MLIHGKYRQINIVFIYSYLRSLGFNFEFYIVRLVEGFYAYEKIIWGELPHFSYISSVLEHALCSLLTLKVIFAYILYTNAVIFINPSFFFCILQHSMEMSVVGEDTLPTSLNDMRILPTVTYCQVYREEL